MKMVYSINVVVTDIKADFDPWGGEYTQITLGYRLPIPMPPQQRQALPPKPIPVAYKHAVHIFIPRDSWVGQYTMWKEYHAVFRDDGTVELKPARD